MTEAIDITNPLILSNIANSRDNDNAFVWQNNHQTQFGINNCATHHIWSTKELIVGEIITYTNIGVKEISESSLATDIETTRFTIKDDENKIHDIKLKNVFYLLEAAKNFISIAQ